MLNTSITIGKSLIYIRNKNGLKTKPGGTPVVIGKVFDLWPLYLTYWHLSGK